MPGRLTLKASHPSLSKGVRHFYQSNPDQFVFPRELEDILESALQATLIHVEDGQRRIVAVGGIYDRHDGLYDIGGVRVTRNGFRLQRLIMETAAVHLHITREVYNQITATTFSENLGSVMNIEAAGFRLWRSAPHNLIEQKRHKAAGRPFRLYYAPVSTLRQMARRLLEVSASPFLTAKNGERVELDLEHPLFGIFGDALWHFANTQDDADEDRS